MTSLVEIVRGIALIVSPWLVIGCKEERAVERASMAVTGSSVSVDRLVVEPSSLSLGTITQNESTTVSANVKNTGVTTVRLQPIDSGRACRGVITPTTIESGKTATLTVSCRTDLLGALRETLRLSVTEPLQRSVSVDIYANVQPFIGFDTDYVDFNLAFGETKTIDVGVIGKFVTDAVLAVKETGSPFVAATILPNKNGASLGVRLRCEGREVGRHAGSLVVTTGIAQQPEILLSWGCKVPGTLEVNPTNPFFNLKVSGDKAVTVEVKSREPNFKVLSARVTEGPFQSTVVPPTSDGIYRIVIRVNNSAILDEARAATGTLLIVSNDRTEPRKEVPLFGLGHVNKAERPE